MVRRGRGFESVRGLCKSPGNLAFFVRIDLLLVDRAVVMELFMELSVSEPLRSRVSSGNTSLRAGRKYRRHRESRSRHRGRPRSILELQENGPPSAWSRLIDC